MTLKSTGIALAVAFGLGAVAGPASAQPLRRNLDAYFIFASKFAHIKNFTLESPCNIGVNCATTSAKGECGELIFDDVLFADGSQAAGDRTLCTKKGAVVNQIFSNQPGAGCSQITINTPPILPIVPLPILEPIIPGTCTNCVPDIAKLQQLCGFPAVFPACDPAAPKVTVRPGQDCEGAVDSLLNNGACDLAPGTYGDINVRNQGKLNLKPGDYNICSFTAGRNTLVTASGTTINVETGAFRANGSSKIGQKCGDLTVRQLSDERITFGRGLTVAAKVCAPAARMNLGHGNLLIGQFVADAITANRDNHGQCCGGSCTCYDLITPTSGKCGDTVTLSGLCDLTNTTGVKVCGIAATFTKTATEVKFQIPAGAGPGQCSVQLDSATGNYVGNVKLTVNAGACN